MKMWPPIRSLLAHAKQVIREVHLTELVLLHVLRLVKMEDLALLQILVLVWDHGPVRNVPFQNVMELLKVNQEFVTIKDLVMDLKIVVATPIMEVNIVTFQSVLEY